MSAAPILSAPEIKITDLHFSYSNNGANDVLSQLSAHFSPGSLNVILGKSGGGKSTLMRLIAGLYQPTSGIILIDGKKPEKPSVDRSLIFQKTQLFPWMTLERNIRFILKKCNEKQGRASIQKRSKQLLKMVQLGEFGALYPYQLSGGMAQRAAFAMTLAQGASLWLMDEPFGALDPEAREEARELLLKIWDRGRSGRTILFVTHDTEEALQIGQNLYFLWEGKIASMRNLQALSRDEKLRLKDEIHLWFRTGVDLALSS